MNTVFVSSTFSDMNYERDIIQTRVSATVNTIARQYGQTVSFCDLRWGIDTEGLSAHAAAQQVLDVCLDEIDRSDPPFVALLGYRYGWVPTAKDDRVLIDNAARRKQLVLDELEISITELEVRYAAMSNQGKKMPALFYFREIDTSSLLPDIYLSESEEHAKKLQTLKKRIRALLGNSVREYKVRWTGEGFMESDIEAFANMVSRDVVDALRPKWDKLRNIDSTQHKLLAHEAFMREKGRMLCMRNDMVQCFAKKMEETDTSRVILQGKAGVGKSTIACALALELLERGKVPTVFLECGLTPDTSTWNGIYDTLAECLERLLKKEADQSIRWGQTSHTSPRNRLNSVCRIARQLHVHMAVVLDAVDQLSDSTAFDTLDAALGIPEGAVSILVTFLSGTWPSTRNMVELPVLEGKEQIDMVIRAIEQSRGHTISRAARLSLVNKQEAANPLYLSMVVQRLLLMHRPDFERIRDEGGNMEAVAQQELRVIEACPHTLEEMALDLLFETGRRINEKIAIHAIYSIAMSRYGLRPSDIRELYARGYSRVFLPERMWPSDLSALCEDSWNYLDFSHVINYLNESFLIREDGRVDFAHRCMRDAVLHSRPWNVWRELQTAIARYLWDLPEEDVVRRKELAFHCLESAEDQRLVAHVKHCMISKDEEQLREVAHSIVQRCRHDEHHHLYNTRQDRLHHLTHRYGSAVERYRGTDSERAPLDVDESLQWNKKPQENDILLVSFLCDYIADCFGISPLDRTAHKRMAEEVKYMALDIANECGTFDAYYTALNACIHFSRTLYITLNLGSVIEGSVCGVSFGDVEPDAVDIALDDIKELLRLCKSLKRRVRRKILVQPSVKRDCYRLIISHEIRADLWMARMLCIRNNEGDRIAAIKMLEDAEAECRPYTRVGDTLPSKELFPMVYALAQVQMERGCGVARKSDTAEDEARALLYLKDAYSLFSIWLRGADKYGPYDATLHSVRLDLLGCSVMLASTYLASGVEGNEDTLREGRALLDNVIPELERVVHDEGDFRARTWLSLGLTSYASLSFQDNEDWNPPLAVHYQQRGVRIMRSLYDETDLPIFAYYLGLYLVYLAIYCLALETEDYMELSYHYISEYEKLGLDELAVENGQWELSRTQILSVKVMYDEALKEMEE